MRSCDDCKYLKFGNDGWNDTKACMYDRDDSFIIEDEDIANDCDNYEPDCILEDDEE